MQKIIQEFKEFTLRGNVVDMAVGIIIGVAFGKIISSFVGDIVMPPLGLLVGGVDFSNLAYVLKAAEDSQPAVAIGYGKFIQSVLDFTIIALAVFLVIKMINSLKKKEQQMPDVPSNEERLLAEIRDTLRNRQ